MYAGDATFHAGWTLHTAPPNHTVRMREVMTVIYIDGDARGCRGITPDQAFDHEAWLGGRPPGEPLDDECNPVLWP